MSNAILNIAIVNPAYEPGNGQPSVIIKTLTLSEDPKPSIPSLIDVKLEDDTILTVEVRDKERLKLEEEENDTATVKPMKYTCSAFGVTQPNGTIYG